MLAPELKHRVRKLWDKFWAGGIANPLPAIEQITCLIFMKRLEVLDKQRQEGERICFALDTNKTELLFVKLLLGGGAQQASVGALPVVGNCR